MNDLSGLDWNSRPAKPSGNIPTQNSSLCPSQSPLTSRQPTPVSSQSSGAFGNLSSRPASTNPQSSNNNSFASLLGPQAGKSNPSLSLQEKQKQLAAEKAKQAQREDPYGASDTSFWDGLGSGRVTPSNVGKSKQVSAENENDLLSAFNAAAPVDSSSHYPPSRSGTPLSRNLQSPLSNNSGRSAPLSAAGNSSIPANTFNDDDDPFGLSEVPQRKKTSSHQIELEDDTNDDILGDLGKPISDLPSRPKASSHSVGVEPGGNSALKARSNPKDLALAELVDMGFAAEQAQIALNHTDTGVDTQAAVGWLLNQAHEQSRTKSRDQRPSESQKRPETASRRQGASRQNGEQDSIPAWARHTAKGPDGSTASTPSSEKDPSQVASEWGNQFLKSANAFWKTSQKKVQKAVADFQNEGGEEGQPRWMREAQMRESQGQNGTAPGRTPSNRNQHATDEATMLDMQKPSLTASQREKQTRRGSFTSDKPDQSQRRPPPDMGHRTSDHAAAVRTPNERGPTSRPQPAQPVSRVTRQAVEEQSAQAYVSPARRKKTPTPVPAPAPVPAPKTPESADALDIFSSAPPAPPKPFHSPVSARATPPIRTTASPAPAARQAPSVSPSILSNSNSSRKKATEAFKNGDYGTANDLYTQALSGIPSSHPITIVLRCNRALTNLKVGDPKASIADADAALETIGASRGEGESISFGGGEPDKPMREFYGKAVTRKAEALEHLEKWTDAAKTWRLAVEAGFGGSVSIQGRNRCEKAAGLGSSSGTAPTKATTVKPVIQKRAPARPKPSALADMTGGDDSAAVKRLREANAAATAASDEQFALSDAVTLKLDTWKGGKADNLRSLLASMDTVLGPESGWKKVGMNELVMPNKVKIVYMKAIAKVHPDKLPQDAPTEQKMVSAAVFATLNEAWDKFKKDNGL